MNKIIIDTDPGVDDALAIMLAVRSGLDVLGITTVYGNSTVENSTRNALTILELLNSNIPLYAGSRQPLQGTGMFAQSHGDNGMGGFSVLTQRTAESEDAITFIAKSLKESKEPIDIVAIGPLTNIARVLTRYPEVAPKIGQLVIMGGVFGEDGNVTKYAEFNAYNDPLAFDITLKAPVRKIIIPADVCRKVVLKKEDVKMLENNELGESIKKLTKAYIDYYIGDREYGNFEGGVLYDVLAVLFCVDERLFLTRQQGISVITQPEIKYGQTKQNRMGYVCKVVVDIDEKIVRDLFIKTIERAT